MNRSPFTDGNTTLRSIRSCIPGTTHANVYTAKKVGANILHWMLDQNLSFKEKDQAVTLASSISVEVDCDLIQVDPQLSFQQLIAVKNNVVDTSSLLKYELCSFPPSPFDKSTLLREADKPAFAKTILNAAAMNHNETQSPVDAHTIVDGGCLLKRISWKRGETLSIIFQ